MFNRVSILGAGMIGRTLAAFFSHCGAEPELLLRNNHPQLSAKKMTINVAAPDHHFTTQVSCSSIDQATSINTLFLCTKSFDAANALSQIAPYLSRDAVIVLTQNGLGIFEACQPVCPLARFVLMPCLFGAKPDAEGQIQLSNQPTASIGAVTAEDQAITKTLSHWLNQHACLTHYTDAIFPAIYQKLIVNAACNALGALYQCNNATLFANPEYRLQAKQLCLESTHILNQTLDFTPSGEEMWEYLKSIMTNIGSNFSSMYQDVKAKKTTEIRFINGYLVDLALKHGLPCPHNQSICQEIEARNAN